MTEFLEHKLDPSIFDYQPEGLDGKTVLISGGTTGIGRAAAILLASQGAKVMIFGRHKQELNDALKSIRQAGSEVFGLTADQSKPEGIRRVFKEVDRPLGGLDILVNNAGIGYESIEEGGYKDWQYVVNTNLLGYMAMAHEAATRMKARGRGHIVNIGSMSADTRGKDSSVYVATKSGIQGFSESLRKEVNSQGIKVTLIEPGSVGTDMQSQSPAQQRKLEKAMKMLKAEDIAISILYALCQPPRCDVVVMQVRPHLQEN